MKKSEERILFRLKTHGKQTADELARYLRITSAGVRQHLAKLLDDGFIEYEDIAESVGRPKRYWVLSPTGHNRFPDSHAQLTLDLIRSVRKTFGEKGLDKLIAKREAETLKHYKSELKTHHNLREKVKALANLRSAEGYMAEIKEIDNKNFLLMENHCPICAAAKECQGFCRSELQLLQKSLGSGYRINREEYLLEEARRCTYRISEK